MKRIRQRAPERHRAEPEAAAPQDLRDAAAARARRDPWAASPRLSAQRQAIDAAFGPATGPRPAPGRSKAEGVDQSPRMQAQRQDLEHLFGTAQRQPATTQLGRRHTGGNPQGRGGRGGYTPQKGARHQVHKGGKAEELRRYRQAIGQAGGGGGRRRRRRGQAQPAAPGPGAQQAPHAQPAEDAVHADPAPVPVHDPVVADDRHDLALGPEPIVLAPVDGPGMGERHEPAVRDDGRRDPPHVAIDVKEAPQPRAPRRGAAPPRTRRRRMGERVADKAFAGRTFGDSSNLISATGNLFQDATAATLVTIGSAGVLTSGVRLLNDGLQQHLDAEDNRARRLARYTVASGLANMVSGAYGIGAGVLGFMSEKSASSVMGVISTAAWALGELTNLINQTEVIIALCRGNNTRRIDYLKPVAALLASAIKCVGACLYVYAAIATAARDSDETENTNAGTFLMIFGAALSTFHGLIKLILVCQEHFAAARPPGPDNDRNDDGPDLELGRQS